MKDTVKSISNSLSPKMIEFCQNIVKIQSLSGEEEDVADMIMNEMVALGYDEVFRDQWGNVVGLIKGSSEGPTIMYNGHMDVVTPGETDSWEGYDPFGGEIDVSSIYDRYNKIEEKTEVLHGRGASDMKGGLAAQIYTGAVLIEMRKKGIPWKGQFLLAAVVFEENGEMMGTIKLTEETLPEKDISVDGMVCAEPSSLRLMLGHRGRMEIKITVHGKNCHGSSPWLGINAVEKAAKLIVAINEKYDKDVKEDPNLGRSGIALTIIDCEPAALCIVPDKCHITYDRRLVPGETVNGAIEEIQQLIDEIKKTDDEFQADVSINRATRTSYTGLSEEIKSKKDVWIIDKEHPFIQACAQALEEAEIEVEYGYWPFSTDVPQIGTVMNRPAIGFSAAQELYIHNPIEKIRIDYMKQSLAANVLMYLKITDLPENSFAVE